MGWFIKNIHFMLITMLVLDTVRGNSAGAPNKLYNV